MRFLLLLTFFFSNDTATTEIYTDRHTLSRHDALPILWHRRPGPVPSLRRFQDRRAHQVGFRLRASAAACLLHPVGAGRPRQRGRSEEHTSELQSLMRISYAVLCLKKKTRH